MRRAPLERGDILSMGVQPRESSQSRAVEINCLVLSMLVHEIQKVQEPPPNRD